MAILWYYRRHSSREIRTGQALLDQCPILRRRPTVADFCSTSGALRALNCELCGRHHTFAVVDLC